MEWPINFTRGAGELTFDMSPDEALAAVPELGPPEKSLQRFDGSVREFRAPALPQLGYKEERLRDIGFDNAVPGLILDGLDVWQTEPEAIIAMLHKAEGGAFAGLGYLLFPKIGVNTEGFYALEKLRFRKLDETGTDPISLTVFKPGIFDDLMTEFTPWEWPR